MALLAALLASSWYSPTLEVELHGDAAYYRPGLMADVCAYRGYPGDGVALMSCGDLGRFVWVEVNGKWTGPRRVCDCSRQVDYGQNLERDRVLDFSWEEWERFGLPLRPVPVRVRFEAPPPWLPIPG
jgi:hypothetical protein